MKSIVCRTALLSDSDAIARIWNDGIAGGNATLETIPKTGEDMKKLMETGK